MADFTEVKVGDQVIVSAPGRGSKRSIAVVERVTATQFTAGGYRFTKRGWQVGGDNYHPAVADIATPEKIRLVEKEQRYHTAQNELRINLNSIDTLWREIDRNHDSHNWAATLEAALPHLRTAIEVLKVRQEDLNV